MFEDFDDDFDEDELKHRFKTKEEKKREQNAEQQRNFRKKHRTKKFNVEFKDGEGLQEMLERLRKDNVTNKEFIIKSYERYVKEGGFDGKDD